MSCTSHPVTVRTRSEHPMRHTSRRHTHTYVHAHAHSPAHVEGTRWSRYSAPTPAAVSLSSAAWGTAGTTRPACLSLTARLLVASLLVLSAELIGSRPRGVEMMEGRGTPACAVLSALVCVCRVRIAPLGARRRPSQPTRKARTRLGRIVSTRHRTGRHDAPIDRMGLPVSLRHLPARAPSSCPHAPPRSLEQMGPVAHPISHPIAHRACSLLAFT